MPREEIDSELEKHVFLSRLQENEIIEEIEIDAPYPIAIAPVGSLGNILDIPDRRIVFY